MARADSNKNIMSEGGHHEIDAAKKRLAAAKATASSASTMASSAKATASSASTMMDSATSMMQTARSMAATARKNEAIAESLLNSSSKEVEKANKLLKEVEKKWEVVDVHEDDVDDSPKKNDSKKRSIVSATYTQVNNSNVNDNNARADSNNNNSMRKYGPPPPPPGDDAIAGSTSPQKRAATIVSEHQRSIQLHLTLLQHVATCNSTTCTSAYCTKMKDQLKHGTQCTVTATGGCNVCKRIRALLKAQQCPIPNCMAIREGVRQWWKKQQQAMAAECDIIPISITIEIFSYLDQESLMNLSLVSKQSHDIICNEPGNENKIIPVFEIGEIPISLLCQNLLNHSLNKETNNKLQRYQTMRYKDSCKCKNDDNLIDEAFTEMRRETRNKVRITGITSLDLDGFSFTDRTTALSANILLSIFPFILPRLREVNLSYMPVSGRNLLYFSKHCPLLEKITLNNNFLFILDPGTLNDNWGFKAFSLNGSDMRHSNSLKEINLDSSRFKCGGFYRNAIEDLNNHPKVYMFHRCCKALERVSIRNPKLCDEDDKAISQDTLIKFVRNAPPSLHWFRSDLTTDNMAILRIERPGIVLLN